MRAAFSFLGWLLWHGLVPGTSRFTEAELKARLNKARIAIGREPIA